MESLALLVTIIVLGRIAYVALCVALVVTFIHHRFVDGLLQARPGLPPSAWFRLGLAVAMGGAVLQVLALLR